DPSEAFTLFGNRAKSGVGGSVLVQLLNNDTVARIEDGAQVHTGAAGDGLHVGATEKLFSFELAQSGGEAEQLGGSGSVSVLNQASTTIAQLASGVHVTGGPVAVVADDSMTHVNIIGAVQLAEGTGIGVSVGVNNVNRNTAAIIGAERTADDTPPGSAGTL